jgi:hypothetical protein
VGPLRLGCLALLILEPKKAAVAIVATQVVLAGVTVNDRMRMRMIALVTSLVRTLAYL